MFNQSKSSDFKNLILNYKSYIQQQNDDLIKSIGESNLYEQLEKFAKHLKDLEQLLIIATLLENGYEEINSLFLNLIDNISK